MRRSRIGTQKNSGEKQTEDEVGQMHLFSGGRSLSQVNVGQSFWPTHLRSSTRYSPIVNSMSFSWILTAPAADVTLSCDSHSPLIVKEL